MKDVQPIDLGEHNAEVEDYYRSLTTQFPVEVRFINDSKGKGLFATRDIAQGELIFSEKPLVSGPAFPTMYSRCCHCMKFLGPLSQIYLDLIRGFELRNRADWAAYLQEKGVLALLDQTSRQLFGKGRWPCPLSLHREPNSFCDQVYCSQECSVQADKNYHRLLCPIANPRLESHWKAFLNHAWQHNPNFILAARLLLSVIHKAEKIGLEAALFPIRLFHMRPWPEIATHPSLSFPSHSAIGADCSRYWNWQKRLWAQLTASLQLLRNSLPSSVKDHPVWTVSNFGAVVGLMEANCLDVDIPSPWPLISQSLYALTSSLPLSRPLSPSFPVPTKDEWLNFLDKTTHHFAQLTPRCQIESIVEKEKGADRDAQSEAEIEVEFEVELEVEEGLEKSEATENEIERQVSQEMEQMQEKANIELKRASAINLRGSGTGLYALHSNINHSCVPNAGVFQVQSISGNLAEIWSLKPITAGEEILVSYLDELLPFHERQAILARTYSFNCYCSKCFNQKT